MALTSSARHAAETASEVCRSVVQREAWQREASLGNSSAKPNLREENGIISEDSSLPNCNANVSLAKGGSLAKLGRATLTDLLRPDPQPMMGCDVPRM